MLAALAEARRRGMATIALVGYDGGEIAAGRPRRPRRRHPLPAHPADPGGPGERVPRAAGAGGVSAVAARARRGRGAGRRLPAVRAPAGGRAGARRVRAQRRARRAGGGRRASRSASSAFLARLRDDAPPLAVVERVLARGGRPRDGDGGFADRRVARAAARRPRSSPPTSRPATDCLRELFDPADRRYRYPFLNCTNCGPRFTIVRGVPYDRPNTTMAGFAHVRGLPGRVRRPRATAASTPSRSPARTAARRCADRRRVAGTTRGARGRAAARGGGRRDQGPRRLPPRVRARPTSAAVAALRARKHREDKPFALMVPRRRGRGGAGRARARRRSALLRSRARPIVLAPRRRGAPVARGGGARARASSGVMLPYTPLHHLLLADARRAARDDQRQRLRRADRVRGRRRARAAGGDRRPAPAPRPADPHAHRRLGGARRRRRGR